MDMHMNKHVLDAAASMAAAEAAASAAAAAEATANDRRAVLSLPSRLA